MNWQTNAEQVLGSHEAAVRCVRYTTQGLVASGSWDGTVKLWDPKSSQCVASFDQGHKVFSMDTSQNKLIVATAGLKLREIALHQLARPEHKHYRS